HFVIGRKRVAGQPELRVDLGGLWYDVTEAIGQLRGMLPDQLPDLLVDGDCFERKTLGSVELADAIIGGDRLGVRHHARLQIADLQQGPSVVRILLDDLLVLLYCAVVLLFVDVLLSSLEYLLAIDSHVPSLKGFRG